MTSKKDKSARMSIETPELSDEEFQEKYPDFESFYRIYMEKIIEGVQEQTNL